MAGEFTFNCTGSPKPRFHVSAVRLAVPTLTSQLALTPLPSFAFAVTVALPAFLPVTLPLASTEATPALLLVHSTSLLVASFGFTVAVSCRLPPFCSNAWV